MTATLSASRPPAAPHTASGVVLEGVSWATYARLRRNLDRDGNRTQLIYDNGRMAILSPTLPEHERIKRVVGRMVEVVSMELNIPIASLSQATWKRKKLLKGCEPDECYYVQHEPQIAGRVDINLKHDPPPDLVIEVEITRDPLPKFPIYAALGVPEIWHLEGPQLRCLHLSDRGAYQVAAASLAFPFLRPVDLNRFLATLPTEGEHKLIMAFRDWVRTLKTQ